LTRIFVAFVALFDQNEGSISATHCATVRECPANS
jgi:hypothetical protein